MDWCAQKQFTDEIHEIFTDRIENSFRIDVPENRATKQTSAAYKLLEARRQVKEVEEALKKKKDEFKIKMEGIESRRRAFRAKEQELEMYLAKFDYYIHDNDVKKARAIRKAQAEKTLLVMKERELLQRRGSARNLLRQKDQLKRIIAARSKYAEYLLMVLKYTDEFNEIRDITSRYETLMSTYRELKDNDESNQLALENEQKVFNTHVKSMSRNIMFLNNKLSDLQSQYDKAVERTKQLENAFIAITETSASKTLELGKIKITTYAMYNLILQQSSTMAALNAANEVTTTEEQLEKIGTYIKDIVKIADDINRSSSR